MEYGFLRSLLMLQRVWYPAQMVLVWDGVPVEGIQANSEYKANRDDKEAKKQALYERVERLKKALEPLAWSLYDPELEADYLLAQVITKLQGIKAFYSTDDDFLGLVDWPGETQVFGIRKAMGKQEEQHIDNEWVVNRCGVTPWRYTLYKAFAGCDSDNLPRIYRVPAEFQAKVVQDVDLSLPYEQQINAVIGRASLMDKKQGLKYQEFKQNALNNYKIVDLRGRRSLPVTMPETPKGDPTKAIELCQELECMSLVDRMEWSLFKRSQNPEE